MQVFRATTLYLGRWAVSLGLLLLAAGCPPGAPAPYDPTALDFTFRVRENGSGIIASALVFRTRGENTAPPLAAGDQLSVNGIPLEYDGIRYTAGIVPAQSYVFLFQPANGPAYRSSVDAPPPARILYPEQGAQLSRSTGFIARWDNQGSGPDTVHSLELDLGITCNVVARVSDIKEERFPFNPDELVASVHGGAPSRTSPTEPSCEGVIARSLFYVYARNTGQLAPGLVGDIDAVVQSSVLFLTVP